MARVAVLAGGPSPEHDVSLHSAACLLGWLRQAGHECRLVLIDREGGWHLGRATDDFGAVPSGGAVSTTDALAGLRERRETAFLGLHGAWGEDGSVQRLLEDAGVPYTGSGPSASAICMDKELAKLAAQRHGGRVAGHQIVAGRNPPLIRIARTVGYPCFVKPLAGGSSVGARRVDLEQDLPSAVAAAQAADPGGKALVEEFTEGQELTVGALRRNGRVQALPVIAIRPSQGFYDFHAKYESEHTALVCPAPLAPHQQAELERLVTALYEALELRGAVRMDVILRRSDGAAVFLELNTLPGFTDHSLVPLACRVAGLTPVEVVDAILADAHRSP